MVPYIATPTVTRDIRLKWASQKTRDIRTCCRVIDIGADTNPIFRMRSDSSTTEQLLRSDLPRLVD